jgi:hypothetical protein
VKQSSNIRLLKNDNQVFKRILNEMIAAKLYNLYGLKTLDFYVFTELSQVYKDASNICLVSKFVNLRYDLNATVASTVLKGFIVDCVLSNWDVYNNENVGYVSGGKRDVIRTDVGGALIFRAFGDERGTFRENLAPKDHLIISSQDTFATVLNDSKQSIEVMRKIAKTFFMNTNDKSFESKIKKIETEFTNFVDELDNKELSSKYKGMIKTIIHIVKYRHEWYKKNIDTVLSEVSVTPKAPGVDGIQLYGGGPTDVEVVVTMSPGQVDKMLEKFDRCER